MSISKTLSHVWQPQFEFRAGRRTTTAKSTATPDPQRHSVQFRYEPPWELVWRRSPQPTVSSEGEDTGQVIKGVRTRTQAQQLYAPEPEAVAALPTDRAAAVQSSNIDPAMLDPLH